MPLSSPPDAWPTEPQSLRPAHQQRPRSGSQRQLGCRPSALDGTQARFCHARATVSKTRPRGRTRNAAPVAGSTPRSCSVEWSPVKENRNVHQPWRGDRLRRSPIRAVARQSAWRACELHSSTPRRSVPEPGAVATWPQPVLPLPSTNRKHARHRDRAAPRPRAVHGAQTLLAARGDTQTVRKQTSHGLARSVDRAVGRAVPRASFS